MPRRNRPSSRKQPRGDAPQSDESLSGRDPGDVSRMARKLVNAGVCSRQILGHGYQGNSE
jgi:hypothetical protein